MDLPFIWTAPSEADSRACALCQDAPLLAGTPSTYHGLEGNDHLQQPFVLYIFFTAEQ
jgi:hypothetical protein